MQRVMNVLGNVAKHILGSLERAFRMMALWGLIVGVIAGVTTEAVGFAMTHEFSGPTHLAAAAIGITFGYAVAVTVAIGEILRGLIRGIELIVKESEELAKEGIHEAELLAQRGEQEALRFGRAAIGDVGAVGRGVIGGAESIEHGVADRFRGLERHGRGHQDDQTAPATLPTTNPPASRQQ